MGSYRDPANIFNAPVLYITVRSGALLPVSGSGRKGAVWRVRRRTGWTTSPLTRIFFFADRRIKSLRARFGCDGITIYIYLLTEIYRNGYYTLWDRDSMDNIIADLNVTEGLTSQVIEFLVSRSLLSSILVGSDTAITSHGIQLRFQDALRGRKRDVYVDPKIWILKNEETASFIKVTQKAPKSENYENKSGKKGDKSGGNDTKESKGKKSNISCVQDAHESAGHGKILYTGQL